MQHFKYLGTTIITNATCEKEILTGVAMGKEATIALHDLTWNENLSNYTNDSFLAQSKTSSCMRQKCCF